MRYHDESWWNRPQQSKHTHAVGGGTLCGLCSSDFLEQEIIFSVCDDSEVLTLSDFIIWSAVNYFFRKSPDDRTFLVFFLCEPSHMCEDLLLSVTLAVTCVSVSTDHVLRPVSISLSLRALKTHMFVSISLSLLACNHDPRALLNCFS